MTDETRQQQITDALAWFSGDTLGAAPCMKDVDYGLHLASEYRALLAENAALRASAIEVADLAQPDLEAQMADKVQIAQLQATADALEAHIHQLQLDADERIVASRALEAELQAEHEMCRTDPAEQRAHRFAMEASELTGRLMALEAERDWLAAQSGWDKDAAYVTATHCTATRDGLMLMPVESWEALEAENATLKVENGKLAIAQRFDRGCADRFLAERDAQARNADLLLADRDRLLRELDAQLLISCTVMDERCAAVTRAEVAEAERDKTESARAFAANQLGSVHEELENAIRAHANTRQDVIRLQNRMLDAEADRDRLAALVEKAWKESADYARQVSDTAQPWWDDRIDRAWQAFKQREGV